MGLARAHVTAFPPEIFLIWVSLRFLRAGDGAISGGGLPPPLELREA